jgi:hypothetical protein
LYATPICCHPQKGIKLDKIQTRLRLQRGVRLH